MFHLFIHTKGKLKGKYDFAFIEGSKYICGSRQGYENFYDAMKEIYRIGTSFFQFNPTFQDDTEFTSVVKMMKKPAGKGRITTVVLNTTPKKAYAA
jgi:hypothetical protein